MSPNNGFCLCPLGKLSHLGLEQLCHSLYINKTREEQVIITVDFSTNFTMQCMPLGDAKKCAAHYAAQLSLLKLFQPHTMY